MGVQKMGCFKKSAAPGRKSAFVTTATDMRWIPSRRQFVGQFPFRASEESREINPSSSDDARMCIYISAAGVDLQTCSTEPIGHHHR